MGMEVKNSAEAAVIPAQRVIKLMKEGLDDKRFIVVSNREPYIHRAVGGEIRWVRPAGGLTAALDPLLQAVNGTWVAWGSGDADQKTVDAENRIRVPPGQPRYTLRRVWLSREQIEQYYHGYCNRFLWPLCHMTLDRVNFRKKYWEIYRQVNQTFAQAVLEELGAQPGLIWIQDYHLALCPLFLKQQRPDLKVALFWHIPWPAYAEFRICPQRQELRTSSACSPRRRPPAIRSASTWIGIARVSWNPFSNNWAIRSESARRRSFIRGVKYRLWLSRWVSMWHPLNNWLPVRTRSSGWPISASA